NLDRYEEGRMKFQIKLFDTNMKFIRTFNEVDIRENSIRKDLGTRVLGYFIPLASPDKLYLSHRKDNKFRIDEYDTNGKFIRQIQKKHNVVSYSSEMRKVVKEKFKKMGSKLSDKYINTLVQLAETMYVKPYDRLYIHDDYMWISRPRVNSGMFHYLNIDHVHFFDIFKDGIFLKNFKLDLSDENILWSYTNIINEYLVVCKKYKNDSHSLELYKISYK
ncbi:MAG: hypothetical protein KAS62_00905, partial [Candidatus Delongbacteria bacterium]|nr:hypothetical protein [Candidatus Delongbacteria bacterium]